jgi:hypothetical protein
VKNQKFIYSGIYFYHFDELNILGVTQSRTHSQLDRLRVHEDAATSYTNIYTISWPLSSYWLNGQAVPWNPLEWFAPPLQQSARLSASPCNSQ